MEKAKFKLEHFCFEKATFDFSEQGGELNLLFQPEGVYHENTNVYELRLTFSANRENRGCVASVECAATFSFANIGPQDAIPEYFYVNSIAILFPYIRAFVSTLSLQANVTPILLPTLNLSKLGKVLENNTTIVKD